jgi:hypothetical protein
LFGLVVGRFKRLNLPLETSLRLDDVQAHVEAVTRRVRVGANLMGFLHQAFGISLCQPGEINREANLEAETTFGARANSYGCFDAGIPGHLRATLRGSELHRAEKTGGIAGSEQLLRIGARGTVTT